MSRHDDRVTLRQMLDHIEEAAALAQGRTREDLETERVFFLALLKLVEIVGEAATRVSDSMQNAHPEIPWREVIGTRNRLDTAISYGRTLKTSPNIFIPDRPPLP